MTIGVAIFTKGDPPVAKRSLPRNVVLLSWVSFFADVSGEMIYPLLPLFIVGVLGAPATVLGGIEGVAIALVAFLTAIAGWQSDRLRKRAVFIHWGYGLPVLGKALLALATIWPVVLVGRSIDRFGKGMRSSPRDAMIADAVDQDQRGRAFGFHRAMDTAGAMVGVLLSAALLAWLIPGEAGTNLASEAATFRWVFAVAAFIGVASLALTFAIKDPRRHQPVELAAKSAGDAHDSSTPIAFSRGYWLALLIFAVFALANSSDAFLLLRAADRGLSPALVVLVYALFNFSYALISYPAGVLSDRFGRWRVVAGGWLLYALVYVGFALATAWSIWPLMALYGVYMALTDGVGKAIIADLAPADRRATALGILHLTLGLSVLVSSVLAGLLWDTYGAAAPFWFGACASLVAVALLVALRPYINAQSPA